MFLFNVNFYIDAGEVARKLAVTEALNVVEKERDALANELARTKQVNQTDSKLAEARLLNELLNQLQKTSATKDSEIQRRLFSPNSNVLN